MENNQSIETPEDLPMTVDEAKTVIEENQKIKKEIIDNVYPWWKTLKLPFFIISAVSGILCLAVIFLAFTLSDLVNDRTKDTNQDTCYQLFTDASSQAIARVRSTNAELDAVGWAAVTRAIANEDIDETFNKRTVQTIDMLVDESNEALDQDLLRIQERDEWVNNGKPLPCPIKDPTGGDDS